MIANRKTLDTPWRIVDAHHKPLVKDLRPLVNEYIRGWYEPGESFTTEDEELLSELPGDCVPPQGAALLAVAGLEPIACVLLRPVVNESATADS